CGTVPVETVEQIVCPDFIAALRTLGLPFPQTFVYAPMGGTLAVTWDRALGPVHATARTTTPTEAPLKSGRAGVAYGALPASEANATLQFVFALRSSAADRSNLAV